MIAQTQISRKNTAAVKANINCLLESKSQSLLLRERERLTINWCHLQRHRTPWRPWLEQTDFASKNTSPGSVLEAKIKWTRL